MQIDLGDGASVGGGTDAQTYCTYTACMAACMNTSTDAQSFHDMCRVTPKGCASVEGSTATKAWAALFNSQQSARALGFSGAKQFGLQHPRIQRMLQSLPEAAYCESYAAWLGPVPTVPPLVGLVSSTWRKPNLLLFLCTVCRTVS